MDLYKNKSSQREWKKKKTLPEKQEACSNQQCNPGPPSLKISELIIIIILRIVAQSTNYHTSN